MDGESTGIDGDGTVDGWVHRRIVKDVDVWVGERIELTDRWTGR